LSIIKRFKVLCTTTLVTNYENERRAQHDALTGLLNRAGLACLYPPGAHIAGLAYTLFCIDLDGFKAVNDTYGHHIGDLLLQAVALRLRSCVKARDCVTRLGGDEFLILAHDLNAAEGAAFADRLIRHITDEPFVFAEGYPIHIGTSVGFACGPEDGDTIEGLTRKADDALYVAKQAGKSTFRRCAPVERPYFAKVS
jgi:diguanylate cyclase (GGDEF)-like protein